MSRALVRLAPLLLAFTACSSSPSGRAPASSTETSGTPAAASGADNPSPATSTGDGTAPSAPASASADDGGAAASEAGPSPCPSNDTSIETYQANLMQMGQSKQIQFVLVDSKPGPPIVGINTFTLRLLDASGNAIPSATFPTIKLWMPYMRHGSSVIPSVMSNGDGTYSIHTIDLIMAGVWQFTFTAQSGSTKDTAMYTFCVLQH
ncbi:MAG TPA: FixH family protein [Polyangiaceae bacterium]|nr:FixH family protein [Polyangiaceae bacterium]